MARRRANPAVDVVHQMDDAYGFTLYVGRKAVVRGDIDTRPYLGRATLDPNFVPGRYWRINNVNAADGETRKGYGSEFYRRVLLEAAAAGVDGLFSGVHSYEAERVFRSMEKWPGVRVIRMTATKWPGVDPTLAPPTLVLITDPHALRDAPRSSRRNPVALTAPLASGIAHHGRGGAELAALLSGLGAAGFRLPLPAALAALEDLSPDEDRELAVTVDMAAAPPVVYLFRTRSGAPRALLPIGAARARRLEDNGWMTNDARPARVTFAQHAARPTSARANPSRAPSEVVVHPAEVHSGDLGVTVHWRHDIPEALRKHYDGQQTGESFARRLTLSVMRQGDRTGLPTFRFEYHEHNDPKALMERRGWGAVGWGHVQPDGALVWVSPPAGWARGNLLDHGVGEALDQMFLWADEFLRSDRRGSYIVEP